VPCKGLAHENVPHSIVAVPELEVRFPLTYGSFRSATAVLTALLAVVPAQLSGQRPDSAADSLSMRYYFHRPDITYGSASLNGPLGTAVNRGMSVITFNHVERDIGRIPWENGWEAVTDALGHPLVAIERYGGWERFLRKEFLPDKGRVWRWAWAPNYGGHIVAGGITYRYLTEWFDDKGVPKPRLAAGALSMGIMVMNEVMESPNGRPGHSATVADLLIFDPMGILVFSFEGPSRFFSEKLQAADWSPQAAITFPDGLIVNHGQLMSYKVPLPKLDHTRLILLIGQGAGTGLQFDIRDEYRIAAVAGFEATSRTVDPATGTESVKAEYGGGLFLDRNNSLLVSATLGKRDYTRYMINIYPGILPGPLKPMGVWANQSQQGEWHVGISLRHAGGLGTGWSFQ
jgi:hypothetical protein